MKAKHTKKIFEFDGWKYEIAEKLDLKEAIECLNAICPELPKQKSDAIKQIIASTRQDVFDYCLSKLKYDDKK